MADDYFVNIGEPVPLRRNILETSKDILKGLHSYENFRELRVQKIQYIIEYKKIMNQIVQLCGQLVSMLPKSTFKKAPVKEKGKGSPKPRTKHESDLEKLERELAVVEGKLSSLS